MRFPKRDIDGQPLPESQRTDDRFELLAKLQGVLKSLGCDGMVVLVDRVDEPHLITGSVERMRALVWSMLDNKFLKQPGLGLKLLLPRELADYHAARRPRLLPAGPARQAKHDPVARMDRPSALRPGERPHSQLRRRTAASRRSARCSTTRSPTSGSIDAFRALRVPRHLFKFLYRLLVAHCNAHTDDKPVWQIPKETFEATLAVYSRDQDAVDRGLQAG